MGADTNLLLDLFRFPVPWFGLHRGHAVEAQQYEMRLPALVNSLEHRPAL